MSKSAMVDEILRLHKLGMTPKAIAEYLNADLGSVEYVVRMADRLTTADDRRYGDEAERP